MDNIPLATSTRQKLENSPAEKVGKKVFKKGPQEQSVIYNLLNPYCQKWWDYVEERELLHFLFPGNHLWEQSQYHPILLKPENQTYKKIIWFRLSSINKNSTCNLALRLRGIKQKKSDQDPGKYFVFLYSPKPESQLVGNLI